MTPERKELIDKFQKFFDTEPTRNIIAAVCANIAEEYASQSRPVGEEELKRWFKYGITEVIDHPMKEDWLDTNKKPLKKEIVVWMSKEIRNERLRRNGNN